VKSKKLMQGVGHCNAASSAKVSPRVLKEVIKYNCVINSCPPSSE
jgi:hypothetical protein